MASWIHSSAQNTANSRKKWNLEDRTSLNNLKTQIAQDGCSDIQYDLARQLLEENETGSVEKHHQGIHWLLRAAHQGHEQAIVLLQDCYKVGRGINESNECEVRLCLEMSPAERAARKAARELFLCLSNGGEFITASQLENKMREIYNMDGKSKKKKREGGSRQTGRLEGGCSSNAEMFTEANLITAAVNYSNGHLPDLSQTLCVTIPHPQSLDHIPPFYRPLLHPMLYLTLLYFRLVKTLATLPELIFNYKIPILLLIYVVLANERAFLINFIPTAGYLATILTMVIATFKMLKTKHEFIDFRLWSGLLQHYGRDLSLYREETESQFLRNNFRPFVYFFGALIFNLMLHPMVKYELLPYSELTIIAFALVFVTMFASLFTSTRGILPDVLIVMSLLVNVLAKYPYKMDEVMSTSWEFFDFLLPSFRSYMIGNGIEFRLNFRAMFYLLIPIFLVQIASVENWRGVYKYLIPHCVTLSWLQIGITCSQFSTMFGLVRAGVELFGAVLFLPLLGLVTMLLPALSAAEAFLIDQQFKIVAFISMAVITVITYGYLASSRRFNKYRVPLQVALYSLALFTYIIPLLEKNIKVLQEDASLFSELPSNIIDDGGLKSAKLGLSYDVFNKYCQTAVWDNKNKLNTRIRCTQLEGEIVKWEGAVKDIDITGIKNSGAYLLSFVRPKLLRDLITCLLGDKNTLKCLPNEDCEDVRKYVEGDHKCNLNKWDKYSYEIRLKMNSGLLKSAGEVVLAADDIFGNFTMRLNHLDRIWFIGELKNHLQSSHQKDPVIELKSMGCVSCLDKELRFERPSTDTMEPLAVLLTVQKSFKYLLNIVFNPLLTFK